jgi:UDP-N-acetylmuramoyl-tripeptide--D-alanyl-D-alanine ligase
VKNCPLGGLSTDSRNIAPGDLFVPLRGERFDGHDYLSQAVRNGAAACLSDEVVAGLPVPVVRVEDTLRALGDIAAAYRLQLKGPLVAITGSAGKTTTKEMLASILERIGPGLKTAGNFNNLIGLPLTLMKLQPDDQWAVLEMGTSALGEIERLTEIARPTIGVITNVGAAHLETLAGLDGVARAKGELVAGLQGGVAVVNLDDPRVAVLPIANGVKKLTYGLAEEADIRAEAIVEEDNRLGFTLVTRSARVTIDDIVGGLDAFRPVAGRMNLFPLTCGGLVLDDCYNSNPLSATAALDALKKLDGRGRRIAVLGDMLELGPAAQELHRELGEKAAAVADLLIAVGSFSEAVCAGAVKAGMNSDRVERLGSAGDAATLLQDILRPGDLILVKGSRGVKLEQVVEILKTDNNGPDGKKGS